MGSQVKLVVAALVALSVGVAGTLMVSKQSSVEKVADVSPTPPDARVEAVTVETFHMEAPEDGIATTHSGDKPLPLYPAGIGALTDERINQGFVLLTKLRDKAGTVVGFTSEQEVLSGSSDLSKGDLMTTSTWTLTIPGRGTIFLEESENQSEFVTKAGIPALTQGKEWNEPWTFVTTVGPSPEGKGVIVGGTGEFDGIIGTFVEITHLRRFTPKGELFGTIELELAYRKAAPGMEEAAD